MAFIDFIQKCINALEKLTDQHILAGMGELLDAKQKVWVKNKLRQETIFHLKLKLDSHLITSKIPS